jgi:DNA-binding CsgD family transcriptional regulator
LVSDGLRLAELAEHLAAGAISDGERRQVAVFDALIAGELSRLTSAPDPQCWQLAAGLATSDPYLHSYALWRLGSALRDARRRREAATVLREAHRVADTAGIRLVAEAVVSAGRSLGVDVAELLPESTTRAAERPFHLTVKEMEVLRLLVGGLTNRRIATALHMTEKTASVHVSHILAKLAVSSRGEAVARAYEVGLARPPVSTGD